MKIIDNWYLENLVCPQDKTALNLVDNNLVSQSGSVIQHFSKSDAKSTFQEIARILKPNATSLIQMPNRLGIRSLQHLIKRGFSEGKNFEVRYWEIQELLTTFTKEIGDSTVSIDGFFGLGIQKSDIDLLPLKYKLVVIASESLKTLSLLIPF